MNYDSNNCKEFYEPTQNNYSMNQFGKNYNTENFSNSAYYPMKHQDRSDYDNYRLKSSMAPYYEYKYYQNYNEECPNYLRREIKDQMAPWETCQTL